MAGKKSGAVVRTFEVLGNVTHNLEKKVKGDVIKLEDTIENEATIATLTARKVIREVLGDAKKVEGNTADDDQDPPAGDPAMTPPAVVTNDAQSPKVDTSQAPGQGN